MAESKIHILQIIAAGPVYDGGSAHVFELATRLPKDQLAVTVLTPASPLVERLKKMNIPTIVTPIPTAFHAASQQRLKELTEQWQALHAGQSLLIHIHGVRAGFLARRALGRWAAKVHIPVIYTEHLWTNDYHLKNRLREWAQHALLRRLDRVTTHTIAVSEAVATFLLGHKITTDEKLSVIPNGVDITEIRDQRSEIREKTDSYLIGSVGSLVDVKGYEVLIEALPLLIQNLPTIKVELIGEGPARASLERLARKLRVADHLRLLGQCDQPLEYCRNWDLFVSTAHSESFGLAIAEAMAAGLPVVATAVGAVPELVTQETGRLIPPRDPHALAKSIIDLLPRRELRQAMSQAASQRIKDHFTIEQMITKTTKLYQQLILDSHR